jgi:hypothetical protein
MPKMNQILAIEKGEKNKTYSDLTKTHHSLQTKEKLAGLSKTYQPNDDDGEKYPDEETRVQVRAHRVVERTSKLLTKYFDIVAARDWTNCSARADIVLDSGTDNETVLVENVPAPYLLWLEKQLDDLYTFASKIPTLPAAETWEWYDAQDCFKTPSFRSAKMKKVSRPLIKYEATEQHPAQVEVVTEDVVVGYWTTTKYSGALEVRRMVELKERVRKLQQAVKFAREHANSVEAEMPKVGNKILGYLFK